MQTTSHKYFGDAWHALALTPHLLSKLFLLVIVQIIPVFGQMVALGYLLGWARDAAWGQETPLPAHVFGRNDPAFWARGAKAWAASFLYGVLFTAIFILIVVLEDTVTEALVATGAASGVIDAFDIIWAVINIIIAFLFVWIIISALMRLAVYESFWAAFQFRQCWKMIFQRFGGTIKLTVTGLLLLLVLAIPTTLVLITFIPTVLSFLIALVTTGSSYVITYTGGFFTPAGALSLIGVIGVVAALLAALFIGAMVLMAGALMFRATGNWTATHDVEAWNVPAEALPSEYTGKTQHGHPFWMGVVSWVCALLIALAAALGSQMIVEDLIGSSNIDDFIDDIEEIFDDWGAFFDDIYNGDLGSGSGGRSSSGTITYLTT